MMGGLVVRQTPFKNVINRVSGVSSQSSCNLLSASPEHSLLPSTTSRCQQTDQCCSSTLRRHRFVRLDAVPSSIAYPRGIGYRESILYKPVGRGASLRSALGRGDKNAERKRKAKLGPDKVPPSESAPQRSSETNSSTPPSDEHVPADIVSESEFWRQQLESSLGDLSGVRNGPIPANTQFPPPGSTGPIAPPPPPGLQPPPAFERQEWTSPPFFQNDNFDSRGPFEQNATPMPQHPFEQRDVDPQGAPYPNWGPPPPGGGFAQSGRGFGGPGEGPPGSFGEPLLGNDPEHMSQLRDEPVKEVEQNSAGAGLTFKEEGQGTMDAGAGQQEQNSPGKPVPIPSASRRPQAEPRRRPASMAPPPREPTADRPSRDVARVDRSELTKLRQSLNKKLSEANMYNRHLLREVSDRDKAVNQSTLFLGSLQSELKGLIEVANEIAAGGTRPVTRKINGRYIQSHLAARLEELYSQLHGQLENVDDVRLREVPITWNGVAEDVKLMGSFDGWTRGQHLSPETTGSYTLFSTVVQLRPGRYEVKFVVDGVWQLAPSWPTIGEGLSANNLLVVD